MLSLVKRLRTSPRGALRTAQRGRLYDEKGGFSKRHSPSRLRSICTVDIKVSVNSSSNQSLGRLAKDHEVAETSVRRLVKEDLKSLVFQRSSC